MTIGDQVPSFVVASFAHESFLYAILPRGSSTGWDCSYVETGSISIHADGSRVPSTSHATACPMTVNVSLKVVSSVNWEKHHLLPTEALHRRASPIHRQNKHTRCNHRPPWLELPALHSSSVIPLHKRSNGSKGTRGLRELPILHQLILMKLRPSQNNF